MSFDYFYGPQAKQFSFYRIPKVLFTDERFKDISTDAKTLYGILLDRMELSARNGWTDKAGRVYIIFTIEEIMEALSCGNKKASALLSELEKKAGLIERKRQGLCKPNLIYVKNFIGQMVDNPVDNLVDGRPLKCQNDTSRSVETTSLEMSKGHGNDTDMNHTDDSDTDSFFSYVPDGTEEEWLCDRENMREYFLEQFDYERLLYDYPYDREMLDEILELMIDTCCTRRKVIRIAGDDKPIQVVKDRFMKLNSEHIRFVLSCMKENTTRVRNMKQYLLAALYNAPMTISSYYSSLVSHNMAHGP
ncbi:MAG: replication initiator protein A [Lachnospiraceae bacterium]|nr:replication initiator protein A [Lachnospiraceae bacterium]